MSDGIALEQEFEIIELEPRNVTSPDATNCFCGSGSLSGSGGSGGSGGMSGSGGSGGSGT